MLPPQVDITLTRCNASGLTPDTCPPGFACTGTQTLPLGTTHTLTRPICEPIQQPAPPLVLDPGPTVPVRITFTLNGGPWPTSTSPDAAGTISFSPRTAGTIITRSVPTQSGELDVDLTLGVYDVAVATTFSAYDSTRYPVTPFIGVLTVAAAGSVQFDVAGQALTFALRLDGRAFPTLVDGDFLSVTFVGHHDQRAFVDRSTGSGSTEASGVVVLEPDTYRVTLTTSSPRNVPTFPSATLVLAEELEVTAAANRVFDLTTYPVAGTVRIDGASVPARADATVSFGDNRFRVAGSPPTRYQGRLLAGVSYDVVFDAFSSPTTPAGATRVTRDFLDGPATFDIDITTTMFSGAITLNGAAPPSASSRGTVELAVAGNTTGTGLRLDPSGDARWNQRVFTGTYDIHLFGQNVFPDYVIPLDSNVVIASPVTRNYNIAAGTVNLALRVDGAQPPDATVGRGFYVLAPAGAAASRHVVKSPPLTGPLAVSLMLEAGVWSVELFPETGYTGLPIGSPSLASVTIGAGGNVTTTYDLHSVVVAGELRTQGAVPASGSRGTVRVFAAGLGFGGFMALPATGPATFSARFFPGVYDFTLQCNETCDAVSASGTLQLASGVRFP